MPTDARLAPAVGMQPQSASLQVSLGGLVEERRLVTVMFVDLSGSTALAAGLDPEEMREILRSYFTVLARRIQRFGGTVDKYIGDAVMAVFGAPVIHEDDAERALSAALAIRDAVAELNEDLRKRHGIEIGLRIGVNTGEVVAGVIAGEVQAAYTVVGDTVNMAQRLESIAAPGQIVVGAATRSAAAHAFDLEDMGGVAVKGRDAPVAAFRLVRASAGRSRRLAQHRVGSPLVGRERELAALVALADRLPTSGHIAAVIGDAGSGKSRLVGEARRLVSQRPIAWIEGRCLAFGGSKGYAPFVEAISASAQLADTDDDAARWTKLAARVAAVLPDEVDETLPYLAALIGLRLPPEHAAISQLTGEAMGRQVFRVVRRYLVALARSRPLVLLLEDLHWADDSTAALVQHVLRATAEAPLLVIGTSRPERDSPAAEVRAVAQRDHAGRYTEVLLEPLGEDDAATLIQNLLAVDDLPAQIRELVLRRSEGNPLYIEELIRSLIESGVVQREEGSGRWRATSVAARIQLPDTIGGLILARVDRAGESEKKALRHAAVIGRSFRVPLLRAVLAMDGIERVLWRLVEDDLLVPKGDGELMFKHVLAQEAIYGSVLRRERREIHLRVAEAIERTSGEAAEDQVPALAYHYARAEEWERAVPYIVRAGDQAGRVAADAEAVGRYRDALDAYASTGRASALELATLERKLGEALFRRGDHLGAEAALHRSLAHLGTPFPPSTGALRRAILGAVARQLAHLVSPSRDRVPAPTGDPVVEARYQCYGLLGWLYYYAGDRPKQFLSSFRLQNMADRTGHVLSFAQGSLGLGIICDVIGLKKLARRYHRRNVAVAEAAGDPLAIGYAYFGLAYHEHFVGEWDASIPHWERGRDAFWTVRDLRRWGVSMWGEGLMKSRRSDPAATIAIGERMVSVADEGADQVLRAWGLFVLGLGQTVHAEHEAAIATERASADALRALQDKQIIPHALGVLGHALLLEGRNDEATAVLEEAGEIIARHFVKGFHWFTFNPLAQAYLEHAERAEGSERDAWLAKADRALRSSAREAKVDVESVTGLHRLRGRREWLRGRRDRAMKEWRTALERGERLQFHTELAATHAEMAWWLHSEEHRAAAAALFARMGTPGELGRLIALREAASRR
jgi:class 3 adenylate cyclase/tetratricopeptide (TPR) repeat protein